MSASPEASLSPRLRILKISFSPSSPYLPVRVSRRSNAGVSRGRKPWRSKVVCAACRTWRRNSSSWGRKSRVPDGGARLILVTRGFLGGLGRTGNGGGAARARIASGRDRGYLGGTHEHRATARRC